MFKNSYQLVVTVACGGLDWKRVISVDLSTDLNVLSVAQE
jgi:hypothetical protein